MVSEEDSKTPGKRHSRENHPLVRQLGRNFSERNGPDNSAQCVLFWNRQFDCCRHQFINPLVCYVYFLWSGFFVLRRTAVDACQPFPGKASRVAHPLCALCCKDSVPVSTGSGIYPERVDHRMADPGLSSAGCLPHP